MIEKKVRVKLAEGLESRMAAEFVQAACQFKSQIHVHADDKEVNAKSIMGVIMLGMMENEQITLTIEGEDEEEAAAKLSDFLSAESR